MLSDVFSRHYFLRNVLRTNDAHAKQLEERGRLKAKIDDLNVRTYQS